MDEAAGVRYKKLGSDAALVAHDSPVLVVYADDGLALCHARGQAEQAEARLAAWLAPRGLVFNEDKTRVVHLADEGCDFLGFTIRRFRGKLLTKPSKAAMRRVRERLSTQTRALRGANAEVVIARLNPIIGVGPPTTGSGCPSGRSARWTPTCGGWSTSGPDTPTRTSRSAGSSPGTSVRSRGPGTTSGCSGTAAAVFTCEDSPGRRSSGTGWCQERRRSTTPPWPTSGRGGAAAGTLCWTRSPCVCSRRKTAAVHGAGVSCCTPTTNRRTPTSGNCGSRWSATRSANTRSSPRRAAAHRTNPPPSAWSTPTAADAKALTPAAAQHLCPSASPRGLLEPDAVGAARPVLRGRGRSN